MIKVLIPDNNLKERVYVLDILLGEFLGVDYSVEPANTQFYELLLINGNKLIIEDHFFNRFPKKLSYLKQENIPDNVEFVKNQFTVETDIPVLFGNSSPDIQNTSITCGIDLFASSFFMLTRWEEQVNKTRDKHNRFPSSACLAGKHDFLHRPVVNEYVEMLWNMLKHLGLKAKRKPRKFEYVLTHDVDVLRRYKSFKAVLRELGGDVLKRKQPFRGLAKLNDFSKIKLRLKRDPFNTFDYLMDISEKVGVQSHFFFMARGQTNYDNRYSLNDKLTLSIIKNIKQRGHLIGIHPTYNAYNDPDQFKREKEELEKVTSQNISFGRQHYLRFEVPTTWQIWNNNDMEWESSLSYADKEGFRCGVCYAYSVFDIFARRKLKLKEKPLIVMEGSFITYQPGIEPLEMENKIKSLINTVRKYNGEFVFLWHNSSFNSNEWIEYQSIYRELFLQY